MNISKKVSSDVLFGFAIQFATRIRGLVFIPVITMALGVGAFGAYTQIVTLASFLEFIFGLALYDALVRYGKEPEANVADLFYSHMVVALLSGILIMLFFFTNAERISTLTLSTTAYKTAFQYGSILILTRILFRLQRNYFRIHSRVKLFSLLQGIKAYALIASVIAAIYYYNVGVGGIIFSMVLTESVIVLLLQVFIFKSIRITTPSFMDLKQHLKYSLPIVGSNLAGNISSRADRVLLGFFIGQEAVGIYSIAYQIAISISMYVAPIQQAYFPELSQLAAEDKLEECTDYLKTGVRWFSLIAFPTVGGMYLVSPDVITILIGGNENPVPSSVLIAVIAGGILFRGLDRIYAVVFRANKQTTKLSAIRFSAASGNIILNVILIPIYGVLGAGVATLLTYLSSTVVVYLLVNRHIEVKLDLVSLLRVVTGTSVMTYIVHGYYPNQLSIKIIGGALTYFVILFTIGELDPRAVFRTLGDVTERL